MQSRNQRQRLKDISDQVAELEKTILLYLYSNYDFDWMQVFGETKMQGRNLLDPFRLG